MLEVRRVPVRPCYFDQVADVITGSGSGSSIFSSNACSDCSLASGLRIYTYILRTSPVVFLTLAPGTLGVKARCSPGCPSIHSRIRPCCGHGLSGITAGRAVNPFLQRRASVESNDAVPVIAWRALALAQGKLQVETREGVHTVSAGQAIICHRGEWIRFSTSGPEGAEYIAVCLPAFSPQTVHRDGDS